MGPILEKKVLLAENRRQQSKRDRKARGPLQATLALQSFLGWLQSFLPNLIFSNFWHIMRLFWTPEKNFQVMCIAVLLAKSVHQNPEFFFSLALKDRNLKLDRIGLLFPFTFIYKQNFRLPLLLVIFDIAQYILHQMYFFRQITKFIKVRAPFDFWLQIL